MHNIAICRILLHAAICFGEGGIHAHAMTTYVVE